MHWPQQFLLEQYLAETKHRTRTQIGLCALKALKRLQLQSSNKQPSGEMKGGGSIQWTSYSNGVLTTIL